jgi:hypothetical protein
VKVQRLYDVNWRELQHVAFGWLTALDHQLRPAQYVATVAVLFLAVCERFKLEPRRVLEVTERIMRHARDGKGSTELRAMRTYLREELKDDD